MSTRNANAPKALARRNSLASASRPVIDVLEARVLLAVTCSFSSGTLTVNSDTDADAIVVKKVGTDIKVEDSGVDVGGTCTQAASGVSAIVVNGGDGNDTLEANNSLGTSPAVTINGGNDNDSIQGGDGADTINGDSGNDTIYGGGGNDSLDGGSHDDILRGQLAADVLTGGNGTDTADYGDKSANLTLDLDGNADDGASGEGDNVGTTVENVVGGSGSDLITGSSADNKLEGGNGNDTLKGGTSTTADGADSLYGDGGTDRADYSIRTGNLVITLDLTPNDGGAGEGDDVRTEQVYGGSGNDSITGDGNANIFLGNDGADSLYGGDGNDSLYGGYGQDSLIGQNNDDYIEGGTSMDYMEGNAGNDTFYSYDGVSESVLGGAGDDSCTGDGGGGGITDSAFEVESFVPGP